jgi:hypothetical protein
LTNTPVGTYSVVTVCSHESAALGEGKEGRLDLNDTCGQPQLATSKRVELEVGGTTITADGGEVG